MKSKNKFTADLKSNKYTNVIIISLIVVFSIYLLYFNDKIHLQDTIVNSLNEKEDRIVENFDVGTYVDVCKNRNTHFYNLNPTPAPARVTNLDECERNCTDASCHVFTFKDNSCYTYKGILGTSGIDTSRRTDPIKISCNSTKFTGSSYGNNYNGVGYINKSYFNNNKTILDYIDPYLEESTQVLGALYSIDNSRNLLKTATSSNAERLRGQIKTGYEQLFTKFTDLNSTIFNNTRNVLYTDMFQDTTPINSSILAPAQREMSYVVDLDKKSNTSNKSDNLGRLIDGNAPKSISSNLRYLILALIMIITVIVLILYKSSKLINEKVLIIYIIIITVMVLFITHYLKL
jgi:hypothetical protein